jgi:DNA polymerase-3 subunit chi
VAEIGFYHLTRSTLEEALPRLLEKVLASGQRAVVRTVTRERLELLDRHLWLYSRESFLPHGSEADGLAQHQPVWLTTTIENPNGAGVLVLVEGARMEDASAFARVLDLFDGQDEEALSAARERWRRARDLGHRLVYWQQSQRGGWVAAREVEASAPSAGTGPSL